MDKRPIIGIFLIVVILVGWQFLVMRKIPPKDGVKVEESKVQEKSIQQEKENSVIKESQVSVEQVPEVPPSRLSVRFDTLENKLYRVVFSSAGGSIVSLQLKKYEGFEGGKENIVELIPQDRNAFQDEVIINNEKIYLGDGVFKVTERTNSKIVYEVSVPFVKEGKNTVEMKGEKVYELSDSSYLFDLCFNFPGVQQHNIIINSGLASTEKDKQMEFRYFGGIASLGKSVVVKNLQQLDTVAKGDQGNIDWVGVKNKYFIAAIIPLCETKSYEMKKFAFGNVGGGCACAFAPVTEEPDAIRVGVSLSTRADSSYKYKIFAGPVDYEILSGTGYGLQEACYLGMKWIKPVSRLFLKIFTWLYRFIPNYGMVIIIFSFLISVVFFPLTKISQKSALSMQRLQPKMQELQKRYKNEPKKLNPAMMELYRKEGVSPVSGCLPMVIQMPVFFALYAVLDTAIALRNAVFIPGWIENLSQPDPYFALPIAMGVMMFLQQKLQGSSGAMNPQMAQQQKMMMYFMPVIFVVIFLKFPAGLVLYWFVYNIFSVAQTYMIKKSLVKISS